MRLKESPLLFQHKDIQYVETSRDKSAPRPSKLSPRDLKSTFIVSKPEFQFSMADKLSTNPIGSQLTKKRQSLPQNSNQKTIKLANKLEPTIDKDKFLRIQNFPYKLTQEPRKKAKRTPQKKLLDEHMQDTQTIEIFVPSSPIKPAESKSLAGQKPASQSTRRRYGPFNFAKQTVASLETDVIGEQASLNIIEPLTTAPQSSKNFKLITESKSCGTESGHSNANCASGSIMNLQVNSAVKLVYSEEDDKSQSAASQKRIESNNSVSTLVVQIKNKPRDTKPMEQKIAKRKTNDFGDHSLNQLRKGLEKEAAKDQRKTRLHKFISALQEQRKFEKMTQFSANSQIQSTDKPENTGWLNSSRLGSDLTLQPHPNRYTSQASPKRQTLSPKNLHSAQKQYEQQNAEINISQLVQTRQVLNNSLQRNAIKSKMRTISQSRNRNLRLSNLRNKKLSIVSQQTGVRQQLLSDQS